MKKYITLLLLMLSYGAMAQLTPARLSSALQDLLADSLMRNASIGFSVWDSKTLKPIFEYDAERGLAPASTQKLFTSCAAMELLGPNYSYNTTFSYYQPAAGPGTKCLVIESSGDPSLGSERFAACRDQQITGELAEAFRKAKIDSPLIRIYLRQIMDDDIPAGWIWEDIGNYYGAPARSFNWRENQYDLILASGKNPGDSAWVKEIVPAEAGEKMDQQLAAGPKGSVDNTVVYLPYGDAPASIKGTIPAGETHFSVSASITSPQTVFAKQVVSRLKKLGLPAVFDGNTNATGLSPDVTNASPLFQYKHVSPPLDTLNYWFLRKSINLYGEALLKTMAKEKYGFGTRSKGIELLKTFWEAQGISPSSLHIYDGSGLSPQNRVTAGALVKVLLYARTRSWYNSFYTALPEYNGMKMKSGSIGGARAFAGYHHSGDGHDYSFAIIVNNYDGKPVEAIRKIYRLLDVLK